MKRTATAGVVAIMLGSAPAAAYHSPFNYPVHRHLGYPPRPHGQAALVQEFGEKCNGAARAHRTTWSAMEVRQSDNKWWWVDYSFNFHQKLGGGSTPVADVDGHVRYEHQDSLRRPGIWGFHCRKIKGSSRWSSHAWGVAIDSNSAKEHVGSGHKHCHSITPRTQDIWKEHNWHHGVSFGDCMHFQYVTGY